MRIKRKWGAFSVGFKALTETTKTNTRTAVGTVSTRMTAFQHAAAVPLRMPPPPPDTSVVSSTTAPPAPLVVSPYRDNASLILPVQVRSSAGTAQRDADLIHVATTLCPTLPSGKNCKVQALQGGLSNELFTVSSSASSSSVLVRIHPNTENSIVDREVENRIMAWLSREQLAPAYYGRFENGRVEEFYNGFHPLNSQEMKIYAGEIAFLLGQMHKLTVPDGILETTQASNQHGEVWNRIETWLQLASKASASNGEPDKQDDSLLDLKKLRNEYEWLKKELTSESYKERNSSIAPKAISFCREVVFTHMDCQSLNVLTNKEKDGQVRLIDFEYAGLNPRAVDIANTFCEYCDMNNFNANYNEEYPTAKQQDEFLRPYLETVNPELAKWLSAHQEWEPFLEAMRLEIDKHTLVSHLEWAVWSIAQSQMSAVEFDYLAYAKQRMEGYYLFRSKFWQKEN